VISVEHVSKIFVKIEKEKGVKGLLKSFIFPKKKEIKVVNDISFQINEGEIVGYVGPNGAGKSTTIKMLSGILSPTSGKILVDGRVPYQDRKENAKNIGVVFGQRTQLWWDLPLVESFEVLKQIYNISEDDFNNRLHFFNELFKLDKIMKSTVRTLSLGERMKADITASLLHNPKILFLDEPTIGLDYNAKKNMHHAIKTIKDKYNTTIILTTHDLKDIEKLCNKIIILDNGSIVYNGSLEDMMNQYGFMKRIEFTSDNASLGNIQEYFGMELNNLKIQSKENKHSIIFNKNMISDSKIIEYIINRCDITDVKISNDSIDNVIEMIYKQKVVGNND